MNQKYGLPIISADIKIRGEKILKDDVLSIKVAYFPNTDEFENLLVCNFNHPSLHNQHFTISIR